MNAKIEAIPRKSTKELEKEIDRIFKLQAEHKKIIKRRSASQRITKLNRLRDKILAESDNLYKALAEDYKKPELEADLTEVIPTIGEITDAVKNLPKWMQSDSVGTPIHLFGSSSEIRYEPKGQALIIAPWNYPFQLTMGPLTAAIAAGNVCIIKPSEYTPNTAQFIKNIIKELFPEEEVAVIQGDYTVSEMLLKKKFDHIFFTGSPAVGKVVMRAAAENLASVTLELGGKSPVVIDESANLKDAAKKITWGKFLNAGQTCVAPDYILIPKDRVSRFVSHIRDALFDFYGNNEQEWQGNNDFCRIVNNRHASRLKSLLDGAIKDGATVEIGGNINLDEDYVSPTVLTNVSKDSEIMHEEIFGPLLPIIPYESLDEALDLINSKEKPLALYVFSSKNNVTEYVIKETSAGGTLVNDVVIHLGNPNLPFGGVNNSGLGNYHGYFGFKAFSHERAIMKQNKLFSTMQGFYPPDDGAVRDFTQKTLRHFL